MEDKSDTAVPEERIVQMTELVDSVLHPIPGDIPLHEIKLPWIEDLLETLNNAIVEHEIDSECLSMSATGKQLKEAIKRLPASKQVVILNEYLSSTKKVANMDQDSIEIQEKKEDIQDRRLRREVIRASVYVFLFLILMSVIAVVIVSWKKDALPSADVIKGLFDTLIQILKFIFGSS